MHEPRYPLSEVATHHSIKSTQFKLQKKKDKVSKTQAEVQGMATHQLRCSLFPDLSDAPEFTLAAHLQKTKRGSSLTIAGAW